MPSLQQITAATALLGLAAAVPVQEKRATAFKLDQVKNTNYSSASPASQYQGALSKWAARTNKSIKPGSVTATPQPQDSEYLCPVTIGSQKFNLDFDTGSSDTWVFGASTRTGGYKPSSSASKLSGSTWKISYGDGSSASGDVYTDSLTVGSTTVAKQAIERATKASQQFSEGVEDGLLGLAFDTINTVSPKPVKTFMDNAIAAGLSPVFTADLKPGAPGSYGFGQVDKSKYSGSIAYTDVDNSQGFWAFTPDNGGDYGIADTGTTLILLSDESTSNYYSQVQGAQNDQQAGGYVFDCNAELPDFTVTVSGQDFVVPGKSINFGAADQSGQTCFGGIQSAGDIGLSIYGDVFLKQVFAIFDLGTSGEPRLGFANKA